MPPLLLGQAAITPGFDVWVLVWDSNRPSCDLLAYKWRPRGEVSKSELVALRNDLTFLLDEAIQLEWSRPNLNITLRTPPDKVYGSSYPDGVVAHIVNLLVQQTQTTIEPHQFDVIRQLGTTSRGRRRSVKQTQSSLSGHRADTIPTPSAKSRKRRRSLDSSDDGHSPVLDDVASTPSKGNLPAPTEKDEKKEKQSSTSTAGPSHLRSPTPGSKPRLTTAETLIAQGRVAGKLSPTCLRDINGDEIKLPEKSQTKGRKSQLEKMGWGIPVFEPDSTAFADHHKLINDLHEWGAAFGIVLVRSPPGYIDKLELKPADVDDFKVFPRKQSLIPLFDVNHAFVGARLRLDEEAQPSGIPLPTSGVTFQGYQVTARSMTSKSKRVALLPEEWEGLTDSEVCVMARIKGKGYTSVYDFGNDNSFYPPTNSDDFPFYLRKLDGVHQRLGEVEGITRPWILASTPGWMFPWHKEDLDLYSVNLQVHGNSKVWRSIQGHQVERFEEIVNGKSDQHDEVATNVVIPDEPFSKGQCQAPLRHKDLILLPSFLKAKGVEPLGTVQRKGELVITFPQGYHSGYNDNACLNEAVNFGNEFWQTSYSGLECNCTMESGSSVSDYEMFELNSPSNIPPDVLQRALSDV